MIGAKLLAWRLLFRYPRSLKTTSMLSDKHFERKDYYEVLRVRRDASEAEIKDAFRELAKVYHPDLSKDQQRDVFLQIRQAHDVLTDPIQKRKYDLFIGNLVSTQIQEIPPLD